MRSARSSGRNTLIPVIAGLLPCSRASPAHPMASLPRTGAELSGDAVIIKPGARHAISHNSGELCEVIAVLASPDAQIGAVT